MTAICPPQSVTAPLTTAPRYGLYSVATVLDDQARAGCGVVYLPDATAASGFAWKAACGGGAEKQLGDEPDAVTGDGFWVITGVSCLRDDIEAVAAARMALQEARIVEQQIWTNALGLSEGPEFDASSTPVLGGGAVSLAVGIGLLEEYLGAHYDGVGAIHSSRLVAPAAGRDFLVNKQGGRLVTTLDTPWAFGQGYAVNTGPGGVAAGAGKAWLYATGQVVVRRGPIFTTNLAEGLDRNTNDVFVIAERPVNVTVDGLLAAVQVTL